MHQKPSNTEDLRAALDPILSDGDAFLVRRQDGVTLIESPPTEAGEIPNERSALQATHPALYGYLLATNQRISDSSGCGLFLVMLLPVLAVCFGLHSQGFHGFVPDDPSAQRLLDSLASWWLYVILIVMALGIYTYTDGVFEAQVYQREREGIRERVAEARVEVYTLIGSIQGDAGLETLAPHLKRDRELSSGF